MTDAPEVYSADEYEFRYLRHSNERGPARLRFTWEVDYDPISDDYDPSETDARELLGIWADRLRKRGLTGDVSIAWFVEGENGVFEGAPFMREEEGDEDFLTHYSWPVSVRTGERLNWLSLPVADKRWSLGRADKGGFIQEATGWKPSPLVRSVNLGLLLGGKPTT